MKILFLVLSDDPLDPPGDTRYGGAQLFMFDLGRHLVRKGHEVVYISRKSRPDKPLYQELGSASRIHRIVAGPEAEINHHTLGKVFKEIREAVKKILAQEAAFDAVLSYNWISGLAAKETGITPHIHHILSLGRVRIALGEEEDKSDEIRDSGELEVFQAATRLVCVCDDELNSLIELYPEIDNTKATVIPYGVDTDVYRRRPLDANIFIHWAPERFKEGS